MVKKGKKSAKLDNMTEEERLLYLEQQRLAEEEMKKKKEDMLQQYLKDKLMKEEKTSKFNLNKINHQWRNIMRETKSRELKKDIEILSQTFERVIDRKESVIKSLAQDLLEAEEQYSMALRSHLENVDNMIDIQRHRTEQLKLEFDSEQTTLMIEFDSERKRMAEQHQREITELQDIIYAMEQNFKDQEDEAKAEFQSMRDEIKNKNMEEKHALRVQLDQMIQNVWSQFQQAMKNYQDTTQDRKKAFEELKLKDEKSSQEIERQMKKLKEIGDKIAQLKAKMAANAKEWDERNRLLREEREVMQGHLRELKSQMNELHELERSRLAKLTMDSNAALKQLKKKIEKGENIMKLAEMCRKLETEEEKVLPFYASSLTAEEEEEVAAAVAEPPSEKLAEVMYKYGSLENFWKRFNKVQLDKAALDREKGLLMHENQQLRMLLKQYLDGISVNDEVISQVNPLFVVNYKSNVKAMNVPLMDGRVKRQSTVTNLPPIQPAQRRVSSRR